MLVLAAKSFHRFMFLGQYPAVGATVPYWKLLPSQFTR